ncbi:hypothetical protein CL651_004200 [bacterium]|nr:hypothetical protein [bacterium]|tara:strand:+ start:4145 stop:4891 length:747 start_codon:yes stop_codon:yes gene_type:complete
MPSCCLQIYQRLSYFKEDKDYWTEYTDFYERFWGGPTSPYGLWFGNEYGTFQNALCEHLNIKENEIKECLFIKEDNENFICPDNKLDKTPFSYLVDNLIPIHWFFIFEENQKKIFKTHWGFGAIHYKSSAVNIKRLIVEFINLADTFQSKDSELSSYLEVLSNDVNELNQWISKFPDDSIVILNYGDLLASFPMSSLDKEDSVKIVTDFKKSLESSDDNNAKELFQFLINRWTNIEFANQKDLTRSSN